ncbi:MAG: hypothetical protein ACR2P4_06695 [Gammaproteobacteria bacterium]
MKKLLPILWLILGTVINGGLVAAFAHSGLTVQQVASHVETFAMYSYFAMAGAVMLLAYQKTRRFAIWVLVVIPSLWAGFLAVIYLIAG